MSELFGSFADFFLAIVKYWWALVPGVIWAVGEVIVFSSDRAEAWLADNKQRVRRYAARIFIVVLFVATFFAYHEERMEHKKTNERFVAYKTDAPSREEFEELREEFYRWPNEGSLDGKPAEQPIQVGKISGIYVNHNTDHYGIDETIVVIPLVIKNPNNDTVVMDVYLNVLQNNGKARRFNALGDRTAGINDKVFNHVRDVYRLEKGFNILRTPLMIRAGDTEKGKAVFLVGRDSTQVLDATLQIVDFFSKEPLVEPIRALY